MAGLTGSLLSFDTYFSIGATLIAIRLIAAIFPSPDDLAEPKKRVVKMDRLGSTLIVSGLILVIFAITHTSHAAHGWRTSYISITLVLGVLLLLAA